MTSSLDKISLAPLLVVNFVGTLGFSIVMPFLVILVTKWGGNAVVYGVLAATYSFFQLFGAPFLGRLSDRIGRHKVLLFSQLGTLLSWGIFLLAFVLPTNVLATVSGSFFGDFAITLPLLVLFLARAADGLTGGNVSVSNAYLADVTSEEDRSRNFGRMAISGNLGFIIGPALAGLLGATLLGEVLPVLAAFGISAAALLLIQFGLKDVEPVAIPANLEDPNACALFGQEQKPGYRLECEQPDGLGAMLALPNMPRLLMINFLVMLGFSFFYAAFPIYAVQTLAWKIIDIGGYFAVLSLFMVVVQGPLLAWASSWLPDRALIAGGSVVLCLGFVTLFSANTALIYAGALLIATGNGLMWPTFLSALSKSAGKRLQGAVQGFASSTGAVASILGLIVGGVAYVRFGASIFLIAAAVILLVTVMAAKYSPLEAATNS
jgi:MFS family permease